MSNSGDSSGRTQTTWYSMRESGSQLGLRICLWLLKVFGYRTAVVVAYITCFYFIIFASEVRRRCKEFHQRALGYSSWFMAYKTLVNFSITILDRAFIQMGYADHFTLTIHGEDIVYKLKESRDKGAIILGSHLGSVEVGPRLSSRLGISVGMLMYEQRSSMLYQELERINPDLKRSIIEMKTDSIGYIFEVRERYQKGGFIGILGDRTWKTGPRLRTLFFGVEKSFPLGAYQIASVLKSPIVFMVIVKQGMRDYHCYVEQIATEADAEGKTRERFSEEVLKKYVSRLEEYCRLFPTHWFNFYDFWSE
jgi:predicted LPLAT superfamily acyltransferase